MRKIILLLVIVISSCQSKNEIHYEVSRSDKNEIPVLNIRMEFNANPTGETVLLLQDKAWGEENLHNTLSNLKSAQVTEIIQEKDSNRIVLKHDKNIDRIEFSYTLQQDTEGDLTTKDTYRPVIMKDYFHVFSHNLFMLPRDYVPNSKALFNVNISWKGFDDDFTLVNSFDTNNTNQKITDTNERYFHSAVFTGGDYRAYELSINDKRAVLGIRGDWVVFNDSTMVNVLRQTLEVQRNFWQDHSQEYFAVTITPTQQKNGSSYQGSGLTNSFATTASNNDKLDPEGLVYLFNHELFHNWIGHTITNENEEQQYWFSEGFTEYYTIKNIAKNNINGLNSDYYFKKLNEFINTLYTSPVKEAPNSEINYDNFWSSWDYSNLPYKRGALFAFYLDHKIHQDSNGEKSLDDLMLSFRDDAVANGQKINHPYFIKKVNELLKDDIQPFFDTHIEQGKLYQLTSFFKEFGYEFFPTTKVYDLGITFSEDQKSIAEIDPNSNAYKAGLRKGDRLSFRSYYSQNADFKAEFKVKKKGKEVSYQFFPAKKVSIPSLKINDHNKKIVPFES